jgi:16S rRNA (cytidine1402-2'-O)-methyltransferase
VVGPPPDEVTEEADIDALLREKLAQVSLKEAVAQVTAATGLPRKQIYARALALSSPQEE